MKLRLILSGCIVLTFLFFFYSCLTFRMSNKEINEYFTQNNINGSIHSDTTRNRTIHYVKAGNDEKPLVFFVHGSPGSLNAFIHFLDDSVLHATTLMIAADRRGFGDSDFGHAEPSIEKQAFLLMSIVQQYATNRPIILVGHSLGGPVIARMAMDFPEFADGLIFVAASVDPELEPKEGWFRIPLSTPFFRWLLPRSFRASNDEIIPLKSELETMKPLWSKIKCPVVVIQGGNDSFVPVKNAEFIRKMITHSKVEMIVKNDLNHFVPWTNPELIRQSILTLLDQLPSQP